MAGREYVVAKDDLTDLVDLPRLRTAIEDDARVIDVFNEIQLEHVRECCGAHYSENAAENENPVNLLQMFIRIMLDQLVPNDPRFLASTFTHELRPYASIYEAWGNRKLLKMDFANILRTAIGDAIYRVGFVKCCIAAPAESRFGYGKTPGEFSMSNIPLQDMIFDTSAKTFKQCDYIGHYYDVFHDDVAKSKLFDRKEKLRVIPMDDRVNTNHGTELVEQIGRGGIANNNPYHKKARLCEIWLRRENVVVTFDAEGESGKPLLVQKWVGPDCGPIKDLSLADVLGNLMPKGLTCDLIDQHRDFNLLWRKLTNQASRSKKNHFYKDAALAKRHEEARDGDYIQTEDPNGIKEILSGGPDVNVMNFAMGIFQLFKQVNGSLDSIGGLSSQADTATQEKLINQSASTLIQALGGRVNSFANELVGMDGAGWFWWNSPREEMKATYQAESVPDVSIDRNLTPQKRFGIPADEIDIQIDTYSFVRQTPQMKSRGIDEIMGILLKTLPMFGQPGVREMVTQYVKYKAKWSNNPELEVLMEKLMGIEGPPDTEIQPDRMPEETTRNYVRESVSGGMSEQGQMQQMMQLMNNGQTSQGEGQEAMFGQVG